MWATYAPTLNRLGLLESLDAVAFAMLCDAVGGYLRIREELGHEQLVIMTGETNYPTPNPLCSLLRGQTKAVRELLSDFGMTPASRSSLTGSTSIEGQQEERDPLAELLQGFAPDASAVAPDEKSEDTKPANGRKKSTKKAAKRKPAKPKPTKRER
jgi:P27 family predicted phage terminase small subunit